MEQQELREYGSITEYVGNPRRKKGKYAREEQPKQPPKRKHRVLPPVMALVILLAAVTAILLHSCGKGDALEGQWRIDEITAYRFDGQGSGELILPEQSFAFAYTLADDRVHIDFVSDAARDFSYTFIIAGDHLTLTGGEGDEQVSYLLIRETEG